MPATSKASEKAGKPSHKPYDRPSKDAKISNGAVNIGAPAQPGQKSRKGKKAWRKNVDITHEEEALEHAREEERITGGPVSSKKNDDLFTVDVVGDVAVAQKLRRAPRPLRSLAVLSERSAVPSLTAKNPSAASTSKKHKISGAEKERLRRIARKSAVTVDGKDMSSADIKTTQPVDKDAWVEEARIVPVGAFGEETMVKRTVKAPKTLAKRRENYLSSQVEAQRGVEMPDEGTSYNPSAEAHARLLEQAVEEEKAQLLREQQEAERIAVLGEAVNARRQRVVGEEYAPGMTIGPGEIDEESEEEVVRVVKPTKRKTQADRNKAKRRKEEARLEAIEKTQKRLLASIGGISNVKSTLEKQQKKMAEAERLAKLAKEQRERMGLEGGEKIGKHRLEKGRVTVQLGEDLAESLRQVKPEGNLFKDRFLALQKKALVEPRVPQMPKKQNRTREYEKHAYKRFV